jgi:hypothetical protein
LEYRWFTLAIGSVFTKSGVITVGVGPTQNIFSFPAAIAVDRSGNVFVVTETYASRRRNKNPLVLIELSEISLKISLENITFASNLVSDRRSAAKN